MTEEKRLDFEKRAWLDRCDELLKKHSWDLVRYIEEHTGISVHTHAISCPCASSSTPMSPSPRRLPCVFSLFPVSLVAPASLLTPALHSIRSSRSRMHEPPMPAAMT